VSLGVPAITETGVEQCSERVVGNPFFTRFGKVVGQQETMFLVAKSLHAG